MKVPLEISIRCWGDLSLFFSIHDSREAESLVKMPPKSWDKDELKLAGAMGMYSQFG